MKNILKRKARIYILPTRMGGYLNGLIFLMFLLSVGYSNNLLLIFTLFLFGLNLIWVLQTHFYLHRLKLQSVHVSDGHAQDPLNVSVYWKTTPPGKLNWNLSLHDDEVFSITALDHQAERSLGSIKISQRSVREFKHLKVKTDLPFGLYTVWIYLPVSVTVFVYPAKLQSPETLELSPSDKDGDNSSIRKGPHDVLSLNPYQGEESRRISWKHYARSGDLLVKEGEDLTQSQVEFQAINFESKTKEYLLSRMATQMVQCSKDGIPFNLKTQNKILPFGTSDKHLRDSLKELAQC